MFRLIRGSQDKSGVIFFIVLIVSSVFLKHLFLANPPKTIRSPPAPHLTQIPAGVNRNLRDFMGGGWGFLSPVTQLTSSKRPFPAFSTLNGNLRNPSRPHLGLWLGCPPPDPHTQHAQQSRAKKSSFSDPKSLQFFLAQIGCPHLLPRSNRMPQSHTR